MNNLADIFEYIAFTLKEFDNVKDQIDRIQKTIDNLDTKAERHRMFQFCVCLFYIGSEYPQTKIY